MAEEVTDSSPTSSPTDAPRNVTTPTTPTTPARPTGVDRDLFGKPPKGRQDWSHRRREPRGLAVLWMLYLMLASVVSLMPMVLSGRLSGDVYRPAARVMAVLVVVGITVLWPVLRVSQTPQRARPFLDVARDLVVLILPAMVLLWPQAILAAWPIPVLGAASSVLLVWAGVSAIVLLCWHRYSEGGPLGRLGATLAVAFVAGGLPLALAVVGALGLGAPRPEPTAGWLWSPVTGVWEVLRARHWSGMPAAVSAGHWSIVRVQLALVGAGLVVASIVCRGGRDLAQSGAGGYADTLPTRSVDDPRRTA